MHPVKADENNLLVFALTGTIDPWDLFDIYLDSVHFSYNYITSQIMSFLSLGLFYREPRDLLHAPLIASEMPTIEFVDSSSSPMIVNVKLKQDQYFSNGDPLTADDFVFTFEAVKTVAEARGGSNNLVEQPELLNFITKVEKIDDLTLKFYLKGKYFNYLDVVNFFPLPQELFAPFIADNPLHDFKSDPVQFLVGLGPFKLQKASFEEGKIEVVQNPYWENTGFKKPWFEKVIFVFFGSGNELKSWRSRISESKTIDIFQISWLNYWDDVVKANITNLEKVFVPSNTYYEISLNHVHPVWGRTAQLDEWIGKTFTYQNGSSFTVRSFWDEISKHSMSEEDRLKAARLVRQAMSHVIPREKLVKQSNGTSYATYTPIPPAIPGAINLSPIEYSIEKAGSLIKQAFELAGWNNISLYPTTTEIYFGDLYKYFPDWEIIGMQPISHSTIQPGTESYNSIAKIGFNVTVRSEGWSTIILRSLDFPITEEEYSRSDGLHAPIPIYQFGGYDMVSIGFSVGLEFYNTELYHSDSFLPKGSNFYNYLDKALDSLIDKYVGEYDETSRVQLIPQIQQYFYDHQPTLVSVGFNELWGINPALSGVFPYLLSHSMQPWWEVFISSNGNDSGFLAFSLNSVSIAVFLGVLSFRRVRKRQP